MKEKIQDLIKNSHKISEGYKDKNGNLIRKVDGIEILQIEEKTEDDRSLNRSINLWRMRNKN